MLKVTKLPQHKTSFHGGGGGAVGLTAAHAHTWHVHPLQYFTLPHYIGKVRKLLGKLITFCISCGGQAGRQMHVRTDGRTCGGQCLLQQHTGRGVFDPVQVCYWISRLLTSALLKVFSTSSPWCGGDLPVFRQVMPPKRRLCGRPNKHTHSLATVKSLWGDFSPIKPTFFRDSQDEINFSTQV